jgi:hypothetical protein
MRSRRKAEPFWNNLVFLLQDSVKEFNVEFPETDHGGWFISRGFRPVTRSPELQGREPSLSKSRETLFSALPARMSATVDGGVNKHEDVAKLFLEPFFQF